VTGAQRQPVRRAHVLPCCTAPPCRWGGAGLRGSGHLFGSSSSSNSSSRHERQHSRTGGQGSTGTQPCTRAALGVAALVATAAPFIVLIPRVTCRSSSSSSKQQQSEHWRTTAYRPCYRPARQLKFFLQLLNDFKSIQSGSVEFVHECKHWQATPPGNSIQLSAESAGFGV
jgi:hypothetical protein